jgi:hypothetical protein
MRVGAIKEGLSRQTGGPPRDAFAPADDRAQSRALVVVEPYAAIELPLVSRQAAFLAQLIATQGHHPQTRARRRAEPSEALAAYRAVAALGREH